MSRLLLVAIAIIVIVVFVFVPPIPQDPAYHEFVDDRRLLGVENFWNVVSNLPFLFVGIAGLVYTRTHADRVCVPGLFSAYAVLFTGVLLTAFGSGWYHLDPHNESLIWDRLPMTIGFAGLFAVVIGEFVSTTIARRILGPLLLLGAFSVGYWAYTEAHGEGDLRPYAIVQFLPMLLMPLILATRRPALGSSRYYWYMILFYVIAKVFEFLDAAVLAAGQLLSGHTLKHLFAALTPATLLYALTKRQACRDG